MTNMEIKLVQSHHPLSHTVISKNLITKTDFISQAEKNQNALASSFCFPHEPMRVLRDQISNLYGESFAREFDVAISKSEIREALENSVNSINFSGNRFDENIIKPYGSNTVFATRKQPTVEGKEKEALLIRFIEKPIADCFNKAIETLKTPNSKQTFLRGWILRNPESFLYLSCNHATNNEHILIRAPLEETVEYNAYVKIFADNFASMRASLNREIVKEILEHRELIELIGRRSDLNTNIKVVQMELRKDSFKLTTHHKETGEKLVYSIRPNTSIDKMLTEKKYHYQCEQIISENDPSFRLINKKNFGIFQLLFQREQQQLTKPCPTTSNIEKKKPTESCEEQTSYFLHSRPGIE